MYPVPKLHHLSKGFYSGLNLFQDHYPFLKSILTQILFDPLPALRFYHPILLSMLRLNVHNRPLHPNISSETLYRVQEVPPRPPFNNRASTVMNFGSPKEFRII